MGSRASHSTALLTGDSTATCSTAGFEFGYDEQSRQEVEKLLKSADDLLYGEISTTDNQLLFKECEDWMNTFPHIRIQGKQLLLSTEEGFETINPINPPRSLSPYFYASKTKHTDDTDPEVLEVRGMGVPNSKFSTVAQTGPRESQSNFGQLPIANFKDLRFCGALNMFDWSNLKTMNEIQEIVSSHENRWGIFYYHLVRIPNNDGHISDDDGSRCPTPVPGNTKPFIPSQLVEIELAFSGTDMNDFGAKLPLPNSSADALTVSFALLSSLNGGDKKITFVPLYRKQVKSRPVGWINVYDILILLQDCIIHLYESELDDIVKAVNENCDVEVKERSIYQPDHVQRITAEEEIFAIDGNIEEVLAIDRRDDSPKDPSESAAELIKSTVIDLLCDEILSQIEPQFESPMQSVSRSTVRSSAQTTHWRENRKLLSDWEHKQPSELEGVMTIRSISLQSRSSSARPITAHQIPFLASSNTSAHSNSLSRPATALQLGPSPYRRQNLFSASNKRHLPSTRLPPMTVTAGRTTVDAPTKSSIPRPMTTAYSRLHRDNTRPNTGGNRLPPILVSNATRIGTPFIKQPENPAVEFSSQSHQRTLRPQTAITFSAPNPNESSSHLTHSNPRAYSSRLPRLVSASTSRTSSVNHINNGKDSDNKQSTHSKIHSSITTSRSSSSQSKSTLNIPNPSSSSSLNPFITTPQQSQNQSKPSSMSSNRYSSSSNRFGSSRYKSGNKSNKG